MKTSTVALAAFLFAIGCGRVVSVDDTVDGSFSNTTAPIGLGVYALPYP